MKKFALVMVLLVLCFPALAVDMPNMIGNWTGTFDAVGYSKNTNYMFTGNASYWEDTNTTIIIQEQNEQDSLAK